MELSWSTFALEIVNFLVLVWILKRFLYKPVLEVIDRRRTTIENRLEQANSLHSQAEALQAQYEQRLEQWEIERQQARDQLAQELGKDRERRLTELRDTLEREREMARVVEARRQADTLHQLEESALRQGAGFAAHLLQEAAGPETETRLVDLLIAGLAQLPEQRVATLRNHYGKAPGSITITTAFPLAVAERQRLEQALAILCEPDATFEFRQDRALVAGVEVSIGTWILAANVRDELEGFAELSHAH